MDPKTILQIDKARIEGMSHEDILAALEAAGHDPVPVIKEYALTPFKDGRLRGQVNLGDPAEWGGTDAR